MNLRPNRFTNSQLGVIFPSLGDHAGVSTSSSRTRRLKREATNHNHERGEEMSKGMDSKKGDKKKPAKTMKEKKAAKQEKKKNTK
jgi:hypothetical protein